MEGDPFDAETLVEIRRLLADVDDFWRRQDRAPRAKAAPGSLAAADDALPEARFVSLYATQATGGAIDHLNAWRLLVNGTAIPIMAHLTLLRAALEGAVRCRWHIDPSVDAGTRVGRGLAARRADQDERRKFEASREGGGRAPQPARGMSAVQRLAALADPDAEGQREEAGIRPVGFADTTGLMITYGYERWFRLTSGLAHGKEWAFVATKLQKGDGPPLRPKVSHGTMSASEPVALALTAVTVKAVEAALTDLERYSSAPDDLARL